MNDQFHIPPPANGIMCEVAWREYLEAVASDSDVDPREMLPKEAFEPPFSPVDIEEALPRSGPIPGPVRWALLHSREFTTPAKTASWFYKDWLPLSQEGCCGQVFEHLDRSPVLFDNADVFFESGIRFHNEINRKLDAVEVGIELARFIWKRPAPIKGSGNVAIVSSLSPSRLGHQLDCVRSWIESGFYVYLMQTPDEIDSYRKLIDVDWIPTRTQRPLIRDMARYGMIVNSDCKMSGEVPRLIEKNEFHLRWNYEFSGPASEEEWGLDACYIDADSLPKDFPFQIGEPFWDYAVPAFLRNSGIDFRIRHKPWLLHAKHAINWSRDDWHRGHEWVRSRLSGDFSSPSYRQSLDPGYSYYRAGFWVTAEDIKQKKVSRDV